MENPESPQLRGIVIITLPPLDKPSLGKTITACTISDSPSIPSQHILYQAPENSQEEQPQLPLQLPSLPENRFSLRRFTFGNSRISLVLLIVSLIALILWVSVLPQTHSKSYNLDDHRSDNEDDDGKPNSFIFRLYPKLGMREMLEKDINLKWGNRVESNSDNGVSPLDDDGVRVNKNLTSVSAVKSSTISPVKGNTYPDGYV